MNSKSPKSGLRENCVIRIIRLSENSIWSNAHRFEVPIPPYLSKEDSTLNCPLFGNHKSLFRSNVNSNYLLYIPQYKQNACRIPQIDWLAPLTLFKRSLHSVYVVKYPLNLIMLKVFWVLAVDGVSENTSDNTSDRRSSAELEQKI